MKFLLIWYMTIVYSLNVGRVFIFFQQDMNSVLKNVKNLQIHKIAFLVTLCNQHTSAKFSEIQKSSLQTRHGLHELGRHMESNHTLHGSELGPHWVLGPKNSKFGPMGPKFLAQKFLYTKLFRYHGAILQGFETKIVLGA